MDSFGLQPDAASYMSLAEAKGYVGITFLYRHETDEMVIAWAGSCMEEMIKSDTENSLLDIFQESFHSVQVNSVNTDIDRKPVTKDLTDAERQGQGLDTIWQEDFGEGSYLELSTLEDNGTETSIKQEVEVEECETAGSTSELSPDEDYNGETMAELEECKSDGSMNGSVQDVPLSQDMYVRDVVLTSSAAGAMVHPSNLLESSDSSMEETLTSADSDSIAVTMAAGSDSTCKICKKTLSSKRSLQSHMRLHTKPFECPVCQERFPRRSTYENHCKTHGINLKKLGIFRCIECRRLFDTQQSLQQHMKQLHDDQPLHFPECNQGFALLKKLNKHIKDNHKCSRHNLSSLTDSIPSEDTAPPTPEHDSDFETRTKEQNTSNAEEEDIVKLDGQADKKPAKPLVIAMKFPKSKKSKEKDVPNAAERKAKIHPHLNTCPVCEKQFVSKSYLKDHMKMHTGEKAFHCTGCSKSFTFRASLKHHLTVCKAPSKTERKAKIHACPKCTKSFTSEAYLKHHIKIHTGEKTHRCIHCGTSFTFQASLKHHLTKLDGCMKKIKT